MHDGRQLLFHGIERKHQTGTISRLQLHSDAQITGRDLAGQRHRVAGLAAELFRETTRDEQRHPQPEYRRGGNQSDYQRDRT